MIAARHPPAFPDVSLVHHASLISFADSEFYLQIIDAELKKPESRRFQWALASNEITKLLCNLYDVFHPSLSTIGSAVHPFFLSLSRLHIMSLSFLYHIFTTSSSTTSDLPRIISLVKIQLEKSVERYEEGGDWEGLEKDLEEVGYEELRAMKRAEFDEADKQWGETPAIWCVSVVLIGN